MLSGEGPDATLEVHLSDGALLTFTEDVRSGVADEPSTLDALISFLQYLSGGYQSLERKVSAAEDVMKDYPALHAKYLQLLDDPNRRGYSVQSSIALEELRKMLSQD